MAIPFLQVALDNRSLESALQSTRALAEHVDVIEAGTILCFSAGAPEVLKVLRALYPDKIIVADLKAADAGSILADVVFSAGATWMTVICNAPLATMKAAYDRACESKGEIQIELYGDWTLDGAKQWRDIGIKQAIYHRGRDAELAGQSWAPADLEKAAKLCELGFEVSMTGGLDVASIQLFKDLKVKSFIVGRTLCEAADPAAVAKDFKTEFKKYWS